MFVISFYAIIVRLFVWCAQVTELHNCMCSVNVAELQPQCCQ